MASIRPVAVFLQKYQRAGHDPRYGKMMSAISVGFVPEEVARFLEERASLRPEHENVLLVTPLKEKARSWNETMVASFHGEAEIFQVVSFFIDPNTGDLVEIGAGGDDRARRNEAAAMQAFAIYRTNPMKVGIHVLCKSNTQSYKNGTVGEVVAFKDGSLQHRRLDDSLNWQKSGTSRRVAEYYFKGKKRVLDANDFAERINPGRRWPCVRTRRGLVTVYPTVYTQRDSAGQPALFVVALGAMSAFGLRTHNSQGLQYDKEILVDLSSVFDRGQGYVAMTRTADPDKLYISGTYDASKAFQPPMRGIDLYVSLFGTAYLGFPDLRLEPEVRRRVLEYRETLAQRQKGERIGKPPVPARLVPVVNIPVAPSGPLPGRFVVALLDFVGWQCWIA